MVEFVIAILVLVIFAGMVSMIMRSAKTPGGLFPKSATLQTRVAATLLGGFFLILFFAFISSGNVNIVFLLIGLALLLYALGDSRILNSLQGGSELDIREPSIPSSKVDPLSLAIRRSNIGRTLRRFGIVILGLIALVIGALWFVVNPDSQLCNVLFGVAAILFFFVRVRGWLGTVDVVRRFFPHSEDDSRQDDA